MNTATAEKQNKIMYISQAENFSKIPGSPVAYWLCEQWFLVFEKSQTLRETNEMKKGTSTGNNERFMRMWFEVINIKLKTNCKTPIEAQESERKWFPINSGGEARKWYGNRWYVVNWENDGYEMKNNAIQLNNGGHWSRYIVSPDKFFKDNITWSAISSSKLTVRYSGNGFIFSSAAMEVFGGDLNYIMGLLNSVVADDILKLLAPTINFGVEQVGAIPLKRIGNTKIIGDVTKKNISISKSDWDSFETSWDFKKHPLI